MCKCPCAGSALVSAFHMGGILSGEFGRVMVGELLYGEHSDTYNGVLTTARFPTSQTFPCSQTQRKLTIDILFGHGPVPEAMLKD